MDQLSALSSCSPCPGGFACPDPGIANLTGFECEPGHYCIEGSDTITPDGIHNAGRS